MLPLIDLPEIVGFFSYSRDDDSDSKGNLSALRDRIQRELRGRLGRTKANFRLWQDTAAIPEGALWEEEIKSAIAQSLFFIPIITPTTIRSRHCKREFELFLAREADLGRRNLIFPLLYIRVPELEDEQSWRNDEVLRVIGSRQYVDWQERRYLDINSTEVATSVGRFCSNIYDALRQAPPPAQNLQRSNGGVAQPQFIISDGKNDLPEIAIAKPQKPSNASLWRNVKTAAQFGLVALVGALAVTVVALWHQRYVDVFPTSPASPPSVDHPSDGSSAAQFTIRKSPAFGGTGGDPFDDLDANPKRRPISAINITVNLNPADHSQRIVGSMQVQWDGQSGQMHGGKGPLAQQTSPVQFAADERITRIFITHKLYTWARNEAPPNWVAGLQIHTNKGFYNFGDMVGPADTCVASDAEQVVGFFGRAGSYIDQLGCIFAQPK